MKPRRVVLLTECGFDLGYGHLMRCLSIANAFSKGLWEVLLIVKTERGDLPILNGWRHCIVDWVSPNQGHPQVLESDDLLIIDTLNAPFERIEYFQNSFPYTVVLDDYRRFDYRQGIIVDWTVLAEKKFYQRPQEGVHYLLGAKYAALREPFWEIDPQPPQSQVETLLLTFGGSDIRELSYPVLEWAVKYYPSFNKIVVLGTGTRGGLDINAVADERTTIFNGADAFTMANCITKADIGISAGGQTMYELAALGVPNVVVTVADNQKDDIEGWTEIGFARTAGCWNSPNLEEKLKKAVDSLLPQERRKECVDLAKDYIDGKGALRLRDKIGEIYADH